MRFRLGCRRLVMLMALAGSAMLLLAACGGSSGRTSYWRTHFSNGATAYMSVVVSQGQVSGWWEGSYPAGQFLHYNGTVNSDGTMDVSAYSGSTLSVNGSYLTATYQDGDGASHFIKTTESAYKSAGGPG